MRFSGTCYRAHDPRWAFPPLSGDGAKIHGGRFNPKGVAALYLALTIGGMFVEMSHGFAHRFDPLTVCAYDVDVDNVLDLRTDQMRKREGVTVADMDCAWMYDLALGRRPRCWQLAERLIDRGVAGILVPSFAGRNRRRSLDSRLANLVLWKWGPNPPYRVTVYDPSGRLPKNQTSWS